MPKIHLYLKKPKGKGETLIYLMFRQNGTTYKISAERFTKPKFWSDTTERIRPSVTGSLELNAYLESLVNRAEAKFNSLCAQGGTPSPQELREALKEGEKVRVKPKTFFEYWEEFIQFHKGLREESTLKNYTTVCNHLKKFEETEPGKITFEKIDSGFYNRLLKYMNQELKFSTNTVGNLIKILKSFLKFCNKMGYSKIENLNEFKVVSEVRESVYLSPEEITAIYNLDLSERKGLERTRDLFVIGCWTGLRFSDLGEVTADRITKSKKGSTISVKTQKTKTEVIIPLHPVVLEILERNEGRAPGMISNQKMNENLKVIGELCKFNELKTISHTKAGKRESEIKNKWELITTHTARRSFATNLYHSRQLPTKSIMKITGHKTEAAFLLYIRTEKEEAADSVLEFWNQPVNLLKVAE